MTQSLQSFGLEYLGVLGVENVKFLLILSILLELILALGSSPTQCLFLVIIGLQRRNAIDDTDSSGSVNSCRDTFFPDAEIVFFELVEVLKLTLEFAGDEKMLCLFVHSEHVVVFVLELLKFDLV